MSRPGVYFGPEKWEALLRGDTSNAVVNRYFVYSFQTIGLSFPEARGESLATVRLLARYAQRAWETFIEIYRTDDQKLKAQALLPVVYSLVNGEFQVGARFTCSRCANSSTMGTSDISRCTDAPLNYRIKSVRTLRCSRKRYSLRIIFTWRWMDYRL